MNVALLYFLQHNSNNTNFY